MDVFSSFPSRLCASASSLLLGHNRTCFVIFLAEGALVCLVLETRTHPVTRTHAHAHTSTHTLYARTHTHPHTQTHKHTHTLMLSRTRTHTHVCSHCMCICDLLEEDLASPASQAATSEEGGERYVFSCRYHCVWCSAGVLSDGQVVHAGVRPHPTAHSPTHTHVQIHPRARAHTYPDTHTRISLKRSIVRVSARPCSPMCTPTRMRTCTHAHTHTRTKHPHARTRTTFAVERRRRRGRLHCLGHCAARPRCCWTLLRMYGIGPFSTFSSPLIAIP